MFPPLYIQSPIEFLEMLLYNSSRGDAETAYIKIVEILQHSDSCVIIFWGPGGERIYRKKPTEELVTHHGHLSLILKEVLPMVADVATIISFGALILIKLFSFSNLSDFLATPIITTMRRLMVFLYPLAPMRQARYVYELIRLI